MSHTIGDAVRMAGHLISTEDRRCTGSFSRDAAGNAYPQQSMEAKWCIIGALGRCHNALRVGCYPPGVLTSIFGDDADYFRLWEYGTPEDRDALAAALRAYEG